MVELHHTIALPERYDLTGHIANGGMASVWAAEDKVLGRSVAIKVMAPQLARDKQSVRRFEREARAAARVSSHPNVVTIFDVGEQAGRAYIVMEYLPGGTVADALLQRRPADPGEALRWLRDAAAALDAAHDQGVVHRDVKPGNLLLDDRRRVRVGDFGIARVATEETMTSTGDLLGTAAYLSPEQSCGKPAAPASDLYSLAVVAFELLTGTRPFNADNFATQARQHVEEDPPLATSRNPDLSAAVDDVLLRGLAKDPDERWVSAGAFVAALERAVDGARGELEATRPLRADAAAGLAGAGAGAAPGVEPAATHAAGRRGTEAAGPRAEPAATQAASPPPAARRARPASPPAPRRPRPAPAPSRARSRGPWVAGGVLAAALAAGAIIALAGGGSDGRPAATRPSASAKRPGRARRPAAQATTSPTPRAGGGATSSGGGATTAAPTTPSGESASALQSRGHALMAAGRYDDAIPVLKRAVAGASPSADTYAFALYDLGRTLRLAGRPGEAIPILEQRLQIPNQTAIVQNELDLARQAAGGGAAAPGASPPGGGNPRKGLDKGKKEKKGE